MPRIVIQHPSQHHRKFHVNKSISSETLYDTLPGADSLKKFGSLSCEPNTIETALSFYVIEGVTSVGLAIYEVRITISPAFDWAEIESQVIEIIKKHLQWEDVEISNYEPDQVIGADSSEGGTGSDDDEIVD